MNCSRMYGVQFLAPSSVISCWRICRKSPCSGACADSTVYPGFNRANTCTHRVRGSSMPNQSHSGAMIGFISSGTRMAGLRAGSRPANPRAETPTMVIG
jgi:hypothetical protein